MKISVPFVVFLTMLTFASGLSQSATAAVTTQSPTNVLTTSAELRGGVTRSPRTGRVAFQIRPAGARRWLARTEWQRFTQPTTLIFGHVDGLAPDTEYEVRALMVARGILRRGQTVAFRTEFQPPPPTTGAATDITARAARLLGSHGPSRPPAAVYFEVGLTTNYGQRLPAISVSHPPNVTVSNSTTLTNLLPDREYHFRLVTTNGGEVSYGADAVFHTAACVGTVAAVTNCTEMDFLTAIESASEVRFECDGVITLTRTIEIACPLKLEATGRSVTLSGGNSNRLFNILPGASLTLSNLALADGHVQGANAPDILGTGRSVEGGAILISNATLVAAGCWFKNCSAIGGKGGDSPHDSVLPGSGGGARGGVISAQDSLVVLSDCVFEGNGAYGGFSGSGGPDPFPRVSTGLGGAVASVSGALEIRSCTFFDNESTSSGGAIDFSGAVGSCTILDASFDGNMTGYRGGAIHLNGGSLLAQQCSFVGNQAWGIRNNSASAGGAVCIQSGVSAISQGDFAMNMCMGSFARFTPGFDSSAAPGQGGAVAVLNGSLSLNASTFRENTARGGTGFENAGPAASGGGGALFAVSTVNATNCTFALNHARGGNGFAAHLAHGTGGGVYAEGGFTVLNACTIASNRVTDVAATNSQGGGIAGMGTITVLNSLLQFNWVNEGERNASGNVYDLGCNLSSDDTPAWFRPTSANHVDALLLPLADNNGPTLTMKPGVNSPALNAADPATTPPIDQRGVARPGGSGPDIGAYEEAAATEVRNRKGFRR